MTSYLKPAQLFLASAFIVMLVQCKKEITNKDFRDAYTGTYQTTSYNSESHFNSLPVWDTIIYHNDLVHLVVYAHPSDTAEIVIQSDTLRFLSLLDGVARFRNGTTGNYHWAVFQNDSIYYSVQDGGNASTYIGHGWIGKKQ